jgi:hypothetical protein
MVIPGHSPNVQALSAKDLAGDRLTSGLQPAGPLQDSKFHAFVTVKKQNGY